MTQPPDELRITIIGVSDLPDTTRAALRSAITEHGNNVLIEARRVVAGNSGPTAPMITPADIVDTSNFILRGFIQRRPSRKKDYATLIGGITTFGGGVFVNNIGEWWGATGISACVLIVAICVIAGMER